MSSPTRSAPTGPSIHDGFSPPRVQAKAKARIRCKLCDETIEVISNFRATAAECPRCGLKFTFDPQQEPLGGEPFGHPGLRLRFADVLEVQRKGSRRSDPLPLLPAAIQPVPRRNWLSLTVVAGLVLTIAGILIANSSLLHRLTHR